jgi:hypothetical protein
MSIKISQSLMKQWTDYLLISEKKKSPKSYQNCGLYVKAKYIDKIDIKEESSDAMKEGIYFEYLATGSLPRSGEVPEPEKTMKGQLTTSYQRVVAASELFKSIIKHYGIRINKTGMVVSTDTMTGILDIWAEWNGQPCIIDLKYSGLIDDKWNELGWETESLPMKDSLMIQGVHYKILINEALGIDAPFYYFIFNSKDSTDMKIIEEVVDPDKFEFHRQAVLNTKASIEKELEYGFKAFPDYRFCKDCPLAETCDKRAEFPQITKVYY